MLFFGISTTRQHMHSYATMLSTLVSFLGDLSYSTAILPALLSAAGIQFNSNLQGLPNFSMVLSCRRMTWLAVDVLDEILCRVKLIIDDYYCVQNYSPSLCRHK